MILAGITVALCGKAHSCNDTLVDERILLSTTGLYKNSIICTNNASSEYVSRFAELAESTTNQLSYIRDKDVFKFNPTVSLMTEM